jgi:4'-phosphopantetheinyl transferase EntD
MKPIVVPHPCESIECGPFEIALLDKDHLIDEQDTQSRLHPDDRDWLAAIKSPRRRSEFLRSRWLLHQMHVVTSDRSSRDPTTGHPIVRDDFRASISHQRGQVAVSVVSAKVWSGVGIDLEATGRVQEHLREKILNSNEDALLRVELDTDWALTLAFSAKESLFKCHHPIGRKMFWFHDAVISSLNAKEKWLDLSVTQSTSPATPAGHVTRVWWTMSRTDSKSVILTACGLKEA